MQRIRNVSLQVFSIRGCFSWIAVLFKEAQLLRLYEMSVRRMNLFLFRVLSSFHTVRRISDFQQIIPGYLHISQRI